MPPARLGRDKEVAVKIRIGFALPFIITVLQVVPTQLARNPTGRGGAGGVHAWRNWLWYLQHPELQRPKHKEAFSCLTTVTAQAPKGAKITAPNVRSSIIGHCCHHRSRLSGILAFILNLDNREQSTMGVISSSFCVLLGTGCGIYIAQNYVPPKIKKLIGTWMFVAKHIE
ncbi:hypothetical protein MUK42_05874 [Musa troglodytarum]|uniref:Uncharacterized protein n=1 Tax=Musa troglodytarum TaxID=320322 RepID=A0A9E7HWZ1_9LILI|nr:hypothetical protein MUK42_05874 [Musa troglodytarum]